MTYYAPGITRVNGWSKPGNFQGGYQIRFFTIADAHTDYTAAGAHPGNGTGYESVGSNFENAVRAIESVATIVQLGTPDTGGSAGFIVGVDGDSFYGRDDHTGYAADTSAATLVTAINKFVGSTSTSVTEVILQGTTLVAGTVANWDNV